MIDTSPLVIAGVIGWVVLFALYLAKYRRVQR